MVIVEGAHGLFEAPCCPVVPRGERDRDGREAGFGALVGEHLAIAAAGAERGASIGGEAGAPVEAPGSSMGPMGGASNGEDPATPPAVDLEEQPIAGVSPERTTTASRPPQLPSPELAEGGPLPREARIVHAGAPGAPAPAGPPPTAAAGSAAPAVAPWPVDPASDAAAGAPEQGLDAAAERADAAEAVQGAGLEPARRQLVVEGEPDTSSAADFELATQRIAAAPTVADGDAARAVAPGGVDGNLEGLPARSGTEAPWSQVRGVLRLLRTDADGSQRLTLRLDPPELGSVRIEAVWREGRLHLLLVPERAVTGELLERSLVELRGALEHDGVETGRLDVDSGDHREHAGGTDESPDQGQPVVLDSARAPSGPLTTPVTTPGAAWRIDLSL